MENKKIKPTRVNICQLMVNTQINYTMTNLAKASEIYSHDSINRLLSKEKYDSKLLWELMKENVYQLNTGVLNIDDIVCAKYNTKKIDLVTRQWSGTEGCVVPAIGIVTVSYLNCDRNQSYMIDHRVYDYKNDKIKKTDHVIDMIKNAIECKKLKLKQINFDSYYSSRKILELVHSFELIYYTKIRKNRIIYIKRNGKIEKTNIANIKLTEEEKNNGIIIKLHGLSENHFVKLFCIDGKNSVTEYVITNDVTQNDPLAAQKEYSKRWSIEPLHKELKQYTGIGQCEARSNQIQRNHIFCSIFILNFLKKKAYELGETVSKLKTGLLDKFLIEEFKSPRLKVI